MKQLTELKVGDSATIAGYSKQQRNVRKKLLAMGLTKGTTISVKRNAPLGDPVEIELRGFNLSLRKAEAAALYVEMEG